MIWQGYRLDVHGGAYKRDWINFYLGEYDEQGRLCHVEVKRGEPVDIRSSARPTFELSAELAQNVMDDLWSAGIRPTEGRQSEGVTAAQARHLEDMRTVAFAKLNIEKP